MTELSATATEDEHGTRLDRFLSVRFDTVSRSRAKTLILAGQVTATRKDISQVVDNPRQGVDADTVYTLTLPEPVAAIPEPEDIPLDIVFEDNDLIIVNKPAGMAVHPAPGSWQGTLVNALLHHCKGRLPGIGGVERPGIVHRIDKLTTGLLVVAKTEAAHKGLSEHFANHTIERTYMALTRGAPRPRTGTVTGDIGRSPKDRKKMAVVPDGTGRHAVTHYKTRQTYGRISKADAVPAATLIACQLETGRTHQIRVHMASLGTPLIGDPVYSRHRGIKAWGSGPKYDHATQTARNFNRQALHAASLGFLHPVTGEKLFFDTDLPKDMANLVSALERL